MIPRGGAKPLAEMQKRSVPRVMDTERFPVGADATQERLVLDGDKMSNLCAPCIPLGALGENQCSELATAEFLPGTQCWIQPRVLG